MTTPNEEIDDLADNIADLLNDIQPGHSPNFDLQGSKEYWVLEMDQLPGQKKSGDA